MAGRFGWWFLINRWASDAWKGKAMADIVLIAQAFNLHKLHPACVEIADLREQLAEAKRQLGRPLRLVVSN